MVYSFYKWVTGVERVLKGPHNPYRNQYVIQIVLDTTTVTCIPVDPGEDEIICYRKKRRKLAGAWNTSLDELVNLIKYRAEQRRLKEVVLRRGGVKGPVVKRIKPPKYARARVYRLVLGPGA